MMCRFLYCELVHDALDELEFANGGPIGIVTPPSGFGLHPDCEGLRKVLRWVALRVPVTEMKYVTTTARPWRIVVRIRRRGPTEHVAPVSTPTQCIRIVDCMTGLVTQNAHAPFPVATFDVAHHVTLELAQTRVSKVEGNGKAGDAVGREPLGRQPDMRSEPDPPAFQLAVQALDVGPHEAAFKTQAQAAETKSQQRVIVVISPTVLWQFISF